MISQEFKSTVLDKNLLRTRIMLKDSFVVDPTFAQFDEMLSYARAYLPSLFVPFDGENLENDAAKWNVNVMNEELVQLVTNFSEVRINHLKKVVAKVLESESIKIRRKRIEEASKPLRNRGGPLTTKESARRNALGILKNEGIKIQSILKSVNAQRRWTSTNVDEMERAARAILRAAQEYRKNR